MADQLQLRGGTTTEHATFTGALREVTVDTTKKTLVVHDNATAGGTPLAKENLSNVPAGTITSTMIADGTIVNADINAAAAIDLTKLANGALPSGITVSSANITDLTLATADIADGAVTSAKIADGTIVNADVNAAAAIAGTKISPDFGSQNVTTTGTSTAASFIPSSSTAPTNGIYLPAANSVAISTGGSERLFVDASGNVGVAVTPSAWRTQNKTIQLGATGVFTAGTSATSLLGIGSNWFLDSGSQLKYIASDFATNYEQSGGNHIWLRAASGTAGANLSWSEQMRLTSTGLGIGTSSPIAPLQVVATSAAYTTSMLAIGEQSNTTGMQLYLGMNTTDARGYIQSAHWGTAYKELLLNPNGGNVGIGTTSVSQPFVVSNGGAAGFEVDPNGANSGPTIQGYNRNTSAFVPVTMLGSHLAYRTGSSPTEVGRWDSSGRLLVGTSTARANFFNASLLSSAVQIEGTTHNTSGLSIVRNEAGSTPYICFGASRGTTIGSNIIVQANDPCGYLTFQGNDGSEFVEAAIIKAEIDGTPGANDMPGRLVFSTTADGASSPTERMRITNAGKTLIGTSDETQSSGTGVKILPDGKVWCVGTSGDPFSHYVGGGYKFYVGTGGGISSTSGTITVISDQRFKENIRELDDGLSKILALQPRKFDWKEGKGSGTKDERGFIAQEFEQVFPDLISEWKDPAPEGEEPYKSVRADLIPVLVKAIQEQQAIIEGLEARLSALESA